MPAYSAPTWTNGSGTAIDQTHLQAMSNALAQALQADGTGPALTALLKIALGTGWQNNSNTGDRIGFGTYGSSSAEVISQGGIARISGASGSILELNVYSDGTNDRFLATGFAKQLVLNTNGLQYRISSASGSAGAAITWNAFSTLVAF